MRNQPSSLDDHLDTRELRRYLEELDGYRTDAIEALDESPDRTFTSLGIEYAETCDWDEGIEEDYRELKTLCDALESSLSDYRHGVQLISDEKFEDHARQVAEDLYSKEIRDASWPFDNIDWAAAASALQSDYTSFEWEGRTFWAQG